MNQNDIDFAWSYKKINDLLTIFKVPLGFFAIIVPAVALVTANHRSQQTADQIKIQSEQNNLFGSIKITLLMIKTINMILEFDTSYTPSVLVNNWLDSKILDEEAFKPGGADDYFPFSIKPPHKDIHKTYLKNKTQ